MGACLARSRARAVLPVAVGPAMTRRGGRWVSECVSGKDLCPGYRRFSRPWNIQGKRPGRHNWMTLGKVLGSDLQERIDDSVWRDERRARRYGRQLARVPGCAQPGPPGWATQPCLGAASATAGSERAYMGHSDAGLR